MDPIFHSAQAMAQSLHFPALINHLREAHRQPPPEVQRLLMQQRSASGQDNSFLIWPAWQHEHHLGIKIATIFPDNRSRPTIQALYVLFDGQDGSLQALLDGTELTYWKTAADSALGADYLARSDARTFLMVGAGQMAPYLIRAYRDIRPGLDRILLWNRSPERAEQLVRQLAPAIAVELVSDLANAVRQADIVCCATASRAPLIEGRWLRPGTHLDLIGGYTPAMREADDAAVRRARLYVDSRWFTMAHVGDLTQPMASGAITAADVLGDLFELCSGRCVARTTEDEITLFKSGGGAHLDLMTAQHIAQQLTMTAPNPVAGREN
jgi:alanine dehydrogenase